MNLMKILKRSILYMFKGIPSNIVTTNINLIDANESLNGRTIIVTGGSKGIGLAIAKKVAAEGAQVIITGRDETALIKASKEINCFYRVLDICEIEVFETFIDSIVQEFGKIDCIVNNAGISLHESTVLDVTPKSWDTQFDTNLKGPFFLTQKFIKYLVSNNQSGNILFISSETGNTCDIRPYGFTKAATNSMVEGMAFLLKNKGIRVNAIAPGITASAMTGISSEGNLYAGTYGQGRFYLPEEIAEVAAFLLSDASDCISGQIITCNNAQTVNARWKK